MVIVIIEGISNEVFVFVSVFVVVVMIFLVYFLYKWNFRQSIVESIVVFLDLMSFLFLNERNYGNLNEE